MYRVQRPEGKPIVWQGSSLDDLRDFPEDARASAGRELRKVQFGLPPADWKFINQWGPGVAEIRLDGRDGAWRVVYVARFREAIYVLHGFQKTSQHTEKRDTELIPSRYHELLQMRSEQDEQYEQ